MRATRPLSLLVSLLLLGLPVLVAGAAPAVAAGTAYSSTVTMSMPTLAVFDRGFAIRGQVQVTNTADPDDMGALAGAEVELLRQWAGADRWVSVGTTTTNQDDTPTYTFRPTAKRNARWKVVYAGKDADPLQPLDYSVEPSATTKGQKVMRDLNARDVQRNGRIYLKGNVDPGWGGKVVYLQRKTCKRCTWKAFDKQRSTSTGGFRFHTPAPRDGSWYFRAKVPAAGSFTTSYSGVLRTWTY